MLLMWVQTKPGFNEWYKVITNLAYIATTKGVVAINIAQHISTTVYYHSDYLLLHHMMNKIAVFLVRKLSLRSISTWSSKVLLFSSFSPYSYSSPSLHEKGICSTIWWLLPEQYYCVCKEWCSWCIPSLATLLMSAWPSTEWFRYPY